MTTKAPSRPPISDATSTATPDWACIRFYESRDTYSEPGGGAYQFEGRTWTKVTGLPGPAEDYAPATQNAAALKLYNTVIRWADGFVGPLHFEPWSTRFVCELG